MIVVLRTPSVAERLADGRLPTEQEERSWSAEDDAAQQQVLSELAGHGLGARPDYSFTRVLDGFSARLDPRAVRLLERDPEIAGVYPAAVAYPATLTTGALGAGEAALGAGIELPGFDGAGVSIALLDTGVDPATAYLGGRVAAGIDIVGGSDGAGARPDRSSPRRLETHATELAGLLVGSGGPHGMEGVASGASVIPIRVAGWQPDGYGGEALYGRSDQLIAGLDRAVDPSGNGDVPGSVRVALIGLAEPYDGFADSPEAQAVSGALALGVLVVAPAGNDGVAGPWYGSVAGPGGSPAALTVGAVDSRPDTASERLVVRQGLDVIDDAWMPLLDGVSSGRSLELPLARAGAGVSLRGKAAVLESDGNPVSAVARAVGAGARAILLEGSAPAAGSLGSPAVPVVWLPAPVARSVSRLLAQGASLDIALGQVEGEPNPTLGALAPFSSRGVSFAGLVDPQLSAPGVELATSNPGSSPGAFVTVSGTSVAAATVAGAAALLAEARPGLSAAELASLLVGSARPAGFELAAGGTGVLDLGASAVAEVAASATSLGFGVWSGPHWHAVRTLTLANVSSRPLSLRLEPGSRRLRVVPAELTLAPGARSRVRVTASAPSRPAAAFGAGVLRVSPRGGEVLRIPWTIGWKPPAGALLRPIGIAPRSFAPSAVKPALLRVLVGALAGGSRPEIEPAARLEIRLYGARGNYLGLLASLRDLLPGRYTFAITGRRPSGARLAPGNYELALLAWPTLAGAPSRARVDFRIQ